MSTFSRLESQLVRKVSPDACAASIALQEWLGNEGIEGGPIYSKEILCIEAQPVLPEYYVEEVANSENDDSDVEDAASSMPTQASAPQLRQLTLLKLFKPREEEEEEAEEEEEEVASRLALIGVAA